MEYKKSDLSQIHHGEIPVHHGYYLYSCFENGWLSDFHKTGKMPMGYSFSGGLCKFDGKDKQFWGEGYWVGLRKANP